MIQARILQWGRCNAILPVLAIFVHRKAVFAILTEKARWEDVFAMQSEMASKVNRETILAIPLKKASILKGYGKEEIEAFLSDLTVRLKCSASTERQALNEIVFLYNRILRLP